MIYTVTLNPCVDKTLNVEKAVVGGTNRVLSFDKSVCGKGINTAVAINNLGYKVCAIIYEYTEGISAEAFLTGNGIQCKAINVPGEIRTNVKIYDRSTSVTTEYNEKGHPISSADAEKMFALITDSINKGDVLVISGSTPPGIPTGFYRDVIIMAKKKGVYTILDADGDLMRLGLEAKPDLIKPNRDELSKLMETEIKTMGQAIECAEKLIRSGIGSVCVSMGKEGAIYLRDGVCLKAVNRINAVKGTVGAGDSMVAGFSIGVHEGKTPKETLHIASAIAAGSVSLPSTELCTLDLFRDMYEKVTLSSLPVTVA